MGGCKNNRQIERKKIEKKREGELGEKSKKERDDKINKEREDKNKVRENKEIRSDWTERK